MKQCTACNTDLPDSARYCTSCGAAAPVSETPKPPEAPIVFAGAGGEAAARTAVNPRRSESQLVKAIIATVCCCLPFGVVAIIYAAQAKTRLQLRDFDGAIEANKKADMWANLSIGIGILVQVIWFVVYRLVKDMMLGAFTMPGINL